MSDQSRTEDTDGSDAPVAPASHFICHFDYASHDPIGPHTRGSPPIYEELICEIDDDDIIDLDDPIDLCDDTDEEVVEVGVQLPEPSPVHNPISPLHIFPFRFDPRPTGDNVTSGVIHMPFSSDPDIESIFARIQQHLRSQAALLGHVGLFGIDLPPRIPPERVLDKLATRRVSSPTEAQSLGACPICLDQYRARMLVRVLPGCGHLVHKGCMDKWILKSKKFTCPLDNIPINVEDLVARVQPTSSESSRASIPVNTQGGQSSSSIRRSARTRRAPRQEE